MKVLPAHYAHMRQAMQAKLATLPEGKFAAYCDTVRCHYHAAGAGDAEKRIRWDLASAAGLTPYFCSEIYQYADDSHIDTELIRIIRDLAV